MLYIFLYNLPKITAEVCVHADLQYTEKFVKINFHYGIFFKFSIGGQKIGSKNAK